MENNLGKLNKSCFNHQDDLLYNLPEEVLVNILSQLSAQDLVRTSILSSRWRNQWKCVNNVHYISSFKEGNIKRVARATEASIDKFLSSIHSSKIFSFYIQLPLTYDFNVKKLLNSFVNFSMDRAVEDFNFVNSYFCIDKFPDHVFQIRSLSRLCISGVGISMPLSVNQPFLRTLILSHTQICVELAKMLVALMPLLESLTLRTCCGDNLLSIYHSKLTQLFIESEVPVKLNTPALKLLVFIVPDRTKYGNGNQNIFEDVSSLIKCQLHRYILSHRRNPIDWKVMLNHLHHVKTIHLDHRCIEDLSVYPWYGSLQPMSLCASLVLELSFSALGHIGESLAKILPLFVKIEKITFITMEYLYHQMNDCSWKSLQRVVSIMQHVKEVEVKSIFNWGPFDRHQPDQVWWEFEQNSNLVKILLQNLKNLKKFSFIVGNGLKFAPSSFLEDLFSCFVSIKKFPKASPSASVHCCYC